MAMPAATPALIDRVEPNWAIEQTQARPPPGRVGQARPLLAEQQQTPARQLGRLERHRAGQVVDRHDGSPGRGAHVDAALDVGWCRSAGTGR